MKYLLTLLLVCILYVATYSQQLGGYTEYPQVIQNQIPHKVNQNDGKSIVISNTSISNSQVGVSQENWNFPNGYGNWQNVGFLHGNFNAPKRFTSIVPIRETEPRGYHKSRNGKVPPLAGNRYFISY